MSKPIKPQLFPNKQVDPEDMEYPLIGSNKYDGVRCLFVNGEMRTRSGKLIQNKALQKKYQWLKDKSKTLGVIFDGELYSHERTFNEISGIVRTIDGEAPDDLKFYAFDCLDLEIPNMPFEQRVDLLVEYAAEEHPSVEVIEFFSIKDADDVRSCMTWAIKDGYEGLILLSPDSTYKQGRITIASGDGYKMKPYRTYDGTIEEVVQATEVDPNASKTINELGYSETSKKQEDRIPVDKAASFVVRLKDGSTSQPTLAMPDEDKREVWANREDYIGRWVEFRAMEVGSKDKLRHPTTVRMRPDLDN